MHLQCIVANRPGSSGTVPEILAVSGKASQMSRKCCYCSYKYSDVIVNYIIALGVGENTYVLLVLSCHVVDQLVQAYIYCDLSTVYMEAGPAKKPKDDAISLLSG